MSTPFDSQLFRGLFAPEDMRAVWSDEGVIRSWLEVWRALATVQAGLGLIPEEARAAIHRVATTEHVDVMELGAATTRGGMPIKPLVDQLGAHGDLVRRYLHWGATTQDVLDTGLALRLRDTMDRLDVRLTGLVDALSQMARTHRRTVMVARTNSQDAGITTWGLHVSSYLTELVRHRQRLDAMRSRVCTGVFGGAVGTLASSGPSGMEVRNRLMAELGLTIPRGMVNASLDHVAELVLVLGLVHGTLSRIGNDVEAMGRTAVGELREGEGAGPSSTMPHKTNPRAANALRTLGRLGFSSGAAAYHLLDQVDVRSAAMRSVSWAVVPEACLVAAAALDRALGLVRHLVVDVDRMRANVAHTRGFVMSEAVMMVLADRIGRGQAYDVLKAALAAASPQDTLEQALRTSPAVLAHLSAAEISRACAPESYLGHAEALLDEALASVT